MTAGASEYAVFVLPTQEDRARFDLKQRPGNVLWREFDTAEELAAYASGIEHIVDEHDEIERLERDGLWVTVGRSEGSDRFDFATEAAAEAFMHGVKDAEGFKAPLIVGRDDAGFAMLADLGYAPPAGPRP